MFHISVTFATFDKFHIWMEVFFCLELSLLKVDCIYNLGEFKSNMYNNNAVFVSEIQQRSHFVIENS